MQKYVNKKRHKAETGTKNAQYGSSIAVFSKKKVSFVDTIWQLLIN